MKQITPQAILTSFMVAAAITLAGCSSVLVKDITDRETAGTSHCSDDEWTDDSSLASLPIPVVAFFLPRQDLNEIKADNYLKRCGDSTQLINREVEVGRWACIPTSLSYLVTLGVWQWCPAHVTWEADVKE